jgi:hypothetical protein
MFREYVNTTTSNERKNYAEWRVNTYKVDENPRSGNIKVGLQAA